MTEIQIPRVTEYMNYTEEIGKNMLIRMSCEKILEKDHRIWTEWGKKIGKTPEMMEGWW